MPGASGEFEGRVCPENSREPRLRAANGARRHPRLQREGPGGFGGQILAPQENPRRFRRGECRGSEGDAPPIPEGVWIRHEPVDFRDGRAGRFRGGAHLTQRRVSGETIRTTLARLLGVRWQRAKRWITSPDPLYERKKAARSADGSGRGQSRNLGGGFPGRVLV